MHRCAILDDYQNVALQLADWSALAGTLEVRIFNEPFGGSAQAIEALQGFSIVCPMRERTPFSKAVIEGLPELRLIVTSGMRNAAIDLAAAASRNIVVCGTESPRQPTAELVFGLALELARMIGFENARLKAGAAWQKTLGIELAGKTLGVVGLGKLGSRVAMIAKAFGMEVIAWSQNLSEEKCRTVGVTHVSKEDLFRRADFVSVHLQLSERTHGLISAAEFSAMKPTAFFINTARGPIVDEAALVMALREGKIAGAGLDVYDIEPLALNHPLRQLDNAVLTPHLGYVTAENYRHWYGQTVECIQAWLDGKPVRVLAAPK